MIKVETIRVIPQRIKTLKLATGKNPQTTKTLKVLAGSSMGPGNPIPDAKHIPGSSINDPFIEKVGYFSDKLVDIGETAGHAVLDGTEHLLDGAVSGVEKLAGVNADGAHNFIEGTFDIGGDVVDATGNALHKVIDVVVDVFT